MLARAPAQAQVVRRDTGFSQGATAAMGLGRALQSGADRWFRLRALAPISGAYDWRAAQLPALAGAKLHAKLTTYLFVAWDRQHDLYGSPREVFKAPYADRAEKLFDGTTPGEVMLRSLPNRLGRLLTDKGYAMLRHPSGRFSKALRVMDGTCKNWTPRVPVRLYVTGTDEQASAASTYRCRTSLRSRGVPLRVVDVGDTDHLDTNRRATVQVARWFTSLR